MATVDIGDLQRDAGEVLDALERTGRPAVVTREGRPVAGLVPLTSDEDLEDFVLAHHPDFVASRQEADAELAAGETVPWSQVREELLAELEEPEDPPTASAAG